jgi:hypothetical protein
MPIKIGNDYELPKGKAEQRAVAKKIGVEIDSFATDNEFHSDKITTNGVVVDDYDGTYADARVLGPIPGLHCPDCQSQAFYTDNPKVAVCGDYPGWYFFFRRLDQDINSSAKFVIRNGELVESSGTEKSEANF